MTVIKYNSLSGIPQTIDSTLLDEARELAKDGGEVEDGSFAEACVNQNSIKDLVACLKGEVDKVDCETWGLTASEWRQQIKAALNDKVAYVDEQIAD